MPRPLPPIEHRFKKGDPNIPRHTQKGPYLTPILKKLLSAPWSMKDRDLAIMCEKLGLKQTVAVALMLRRVLNAAEGDDHAIERILDRIDGKLPIPIQEAKKEDENLLEAEFEIVPNGDKPGAIERFKDFIN
jgi:hypothetical protein